MALSQTDTKSIVNSSNIERYTIRCKSQDDFLDKRSITSQNLMGGML